MPSKLEQQEIKHHFIQNKSIHKPYNAGKFEKEGLKLLKNLFQKHDKIIMVGGSGLYAKALIDGLDKFPKTEPEAVKKIKELYQSSGLKGLKLALAKIDPEYYQKKYFKIIHNLENKNSSPLSKFVTLRKEKFNFFS